MRKSSCARLLVGALAALAAAPAFTEELPACLRGCMAETDDARRLACFDRETARLAGESAAGAPVASAAPAAIAGTPEERFGLPAQISRNEIARKTGAAPDLPKLSSTVSALEPRSGGEALVTLQNGQVWVVKAGEDSSRLRVGREISIRRGALGSYLLYDGAGHALRVSRLTEPQDSAAR